MQLRSQFKAKKVLAAIPAVALVVSGAAAWAGTVTDDPNPTIPSAPTVPGAPAAVVATTGTGLGFPGLGNFNPLCSNPFFFNIDDTVPDGTAPWSSHQRQRSSFTTNCLAASLLRGS